MFNLYVLMCVCQGRATELLIILLLNYFLGTTAVGMGVPSIRVSCWRRSWARLNSYSLLGWIRSIRNMVSPPDCRGGAEWWVLSFHFGACHGQQPKLFGGCWRSLYSVIYTCNGQCFMYWMGFEDWILQTTIIAKICNCLKKIFLCVSYVHGFDSRNTQTDTIWVRGWDNISNFHFV